MTLSDENSIILITGTELRHQFFIRQIHSKFPVKAVLTEKIQYPPLPKLSKTLQKEWDRFFRERDICERTLFALPKPSDSFSPPVSINIPNGKLNSPETLSHLERLEPGFIALFDSNLIGAKMMERFPDRIFNLHLGLTELYRGSSCNFWPIHDGHPEQLGATILKINRGIDTGDVVTQKGIELKPTDNFQALMGKVVITGVGLMLDTIDSWKNGTLRTKPLAKKGTLFLRNQFTPEAIHRVRTMADNGEISKRIADVL